MKKFKTITLASTKLNEGIISIAKQCHEILASKGVEVLIDENLNKLKPLGLSTSSTNEISKRSDLLIVIGGDGTMLNCARKYGFNNIPLLGINLGNLGFLTDIDPEDLTSSLLGVLEGRYTEEKRFFLEATIKGNRDQHIALNELVIHSGEIAQLIEYDLYLEDNFVYRQKADGLIISSPTGSTGYSLSGGGPIIHPKIEAMILCPMLPLSLSTSPLVVDADSVVKVSLVDKTKRAQLSFDSHTNLILKGQQEIKVTKSKSKVRLIHPEGNDFFQACRNKLGWSSR